MWILNHDYVTNPKMISYVKYFKVGKRENPNCLSLFIAYSRRAAIKMVDPYRNEYCMTQLEAYCNDEHF